MNYKYNMKNIDRKKKVIYLLSYILPFRFRRVKQVERVSKCLEIIYTIVFDRKRDDIYVVKEKKQYTKAK